MAAKVAMTRRGRDRLFLALLLVVAGLAFGYWRADRRAAEAEVNLPYQSAKVLSEQFAKTARLQVATLSGEVAATSSDAQLGGLLVSSQRRQLPYSVDYFVDLRGLKPGDFRWNAKEKTMLVTLPDIVVGAPNIDEARARPESPTGLIVTRGAAQRLQQAISSRANGIAAEAARQPDKLARAREAGREAIGNLVRAPLAAAGLGEVRVATRYAIEGDGTPYELWDESTPLSEVLGTKGGR